MAAYVKTTWVNGATALSADNMNKIENELVALDTGKVDKVTGKDLSTNDFTNEYKSKLDGIAAGAEVNQNAFSNVKVGDSTVAADSKTDTLELVAGSNVTLTADTTNDKVTIASQYSNATTSAAGLMSAADKTKLDGLFDLIYPVGSIFMSVANTNPGTYLTGTTWAAWGTGRVPVGVDTSQSEFDTVEETGGAKTHTLTVNEMPQHRHTVDDLISGTGTKKEGTGTQYTAVLGKTASVENTSEAGGGQSHNNLQPYITCYMWKRTA